MQATSIQDLELPAADLTLDALAKRSFEALGTLYRKGRCARSMRAVDGAPKGRALAVRGIDSIPLAARWVHGLEGSSHFVWDGKTFQASSDREGAGINRVQIPGALGRQKLFPFDTRFGKSLFDDAPTLILDYDLPQNPFWIRGIHDEIREVSSGLFLGPAMWKTRPSEATTLLWFALDTTTRGWS
jgi:hypothetical protein